MRRLWLLALVTLWTAGCMRNPDDPKTWLRQINKSTFKREEALVNLYRIHVMYSELAKQKGKDGARARKFLAKFRKVVNPVLVKTFDKKINGKYVALDDILSRLIEFEAAEAAPLFLRLIREYTNGDIEKYGDEDTQEGLVAKAVEGLGRLAMQRKCPEEALEALDQLVNRICVKHSASKALEETLDPRSFVRNAVVKAMPEIIKAFPEKRQVMGHMLATILDYGFEKGEVQDPMVNIFAARSLGDVGDISPRTVRALVKCLYRKGRGRAFHPYCTVALAKLPDGPDGWHPAIPPLRLLVQGDPWKRVLKQLKKQKKTKEAEALQKQLKAGGTMPTCPDFIPTKYRYVCEIYW